MLVEGFKGESHPKLEVRRRDAVHRKPLAPEDPTVLAIAADFEVEGAGVPVFTLDDVGAIADFIAARVLPHHREL